MNWNSASKTSLAYVLFGTLWIVVADQTAPAFPQAINVQTLSGLILVGMTGVLFYWLLPRHRTTQAEQQGFHPAVIDASPVPTYTVSLDGRVLTWNKAAERIFGWQAEEVIGEYLPTVPNDEKEEFNTLMNRVVNHEPISSMNVQRQTKDGYIFDGKLSAAPILDGDGNIIAIVVVMEDITEQKQTIKALQESEEKFRTLVDGAPDGIFVQLDGRFDYVNDAYLKMIGADSADELVGTEVADRVHPDDQAQVAAAIKRLNEESQGTPLVERSHMRLDGQSVAVEVTAVPFRQGDQSGGLVFVRDITRRIHANNERQRLFQAIDQASDAIVITDADGWIEYVNPAFELISGYSRKEAIGEHTNIQRSGVHDDSFYQNIWTTIRSGEVWRDRIVNRKKDGSLYTEEISIAPVYDASGAIINYVSVQRDVSRELTLENQLHHAQKMETVGRLAGGVAHDFNNMLGIILGSTEMLLSSPDITESVREDLNEIRLAAQKSADLTRQLLTFERKQTIAPTVLDLQHTISTLLRMLDRLVGVRIDLRFNQDGDPCLVNMDPTQIDQVLANLVVNARDAITGSGEIAIDISNITLGDTDCIDKPGLRAGQYALLTVTDHGAGMSESVLSQIFEPFFTTKSDGTGTGLGLATVYAIVKQNDGYIEAHSREGEGTRFDIYLPGCDTTEGGTNESDVLSITPSATETILLVEDEASLLSLAKRMLQRLGYTVLATTNPPQAIELMHQHMETIDLLLTDLTLPEMNGHQLYEEIHKINPNIKVLFTSGYADEGEYIRSHTDYGGYAFMQKPYSSDTLAAKLRESLKDEPVA